MLDACVKLFGGDGPDFNSLSPEEKDRIYQDLHDQLINLVPQKKSSAYKALSWGDPGPALESCLV
jgi:hypothetical protein